MPKGGQVEKLSEDELAYHSEVVARQKAAQETYHQAEIVLIAAGGALESWLHHLAKKYALDAEDEITPAGDLMRKGRLGA